MGRAASRSRIRWISCYDSRVKFDLGILATQPVAEIVKQVQLAEDLGFETVWMTDTHLVCRELWVTLTACVLGTKRIKLGPGVTVPHSRHASVTASAILTLEELAPGRIVLGMGTGGSSAQTMGLRLEEVGRVGALETMATNIRRLTRGETMRFESGTEGKIVWLEAPRDKQAALVKSIAGTPFFEKVRGKAITSLYNNELAFAHFGYEGNAWRKGGGYLTRGFNDLKWLPNPSEKASPKPFLG